MYIEIRRATNDDLDGLLPLVEDFVASFELNQSSFRESFSRLQSNPDAITLVAVEKGKLIGYCLGFCHDTFYANGKVAWLEEIMVSEAFRRKRVGASLMSEFEVWAKSKGAVLSALATRRGSSFYEAISYDPSATYYRKLL
ncbi:MAG: GNAT family N-acetyltransferase [Halioglobus sp.]|nr:GNAT family N-acetyltransferase [Halioglobus sp.]